MLTDHQAAVKALAWSPHERNLLASGGGTADRSIKFWNAASGALINSVDTGSQGMTVQIVHDSTSLKKNIILKLLLDNVVCALQWSPFEKELLSR